MENAFVTYQSFYFTTANSQEGLNALTQQELFSRRITKHQALQLAYEALHETDFIGKPSAIHAHLNQLFHQLVQIIDQLYAKETKVNTGMLANEIKLRYADVPSPIESLLIALGDTDVYYQKKPANVNIHN